MLRVVETKAEKQLRLDGIGLLHDALIFTELHEVTDWNFGTVRTALSLLRKETFTDEDYRELRKKLTEGGFRIFPQTD